MAPSEGEPAARLGLPPREAEVLRLLARRLTANEIAEALYFSPHPVNRHTANLFAKLGVANRTQAASRARELGLRI